MARMIGSTSRSKSKASENAYKNAEDALYEGAKVASSVFTPTGIPGTAVDNVVNHMNQTFNDKDVEEQLAMIPFMNDVAYGLERQKWYEDYKRNTNGIIKYPQTALRGTGAISSGAINFANSFDWWL